MSELSIRQFHYKLTVWKILRLDCLIFELEVLNSFLISLTLIS